MKLRAADGEILWKIHSGGPSRQADRGWSIVVGPDGNPVVTGVLATTVDPAYFCTIKLRSADGGEIWNRTILGAINYIEREAGWLAVCDDGDIVMASRTWAGSSSYDVVLHRYDAADGAIVWQKQYDSPSHAGDDANRMVRDAAGNLIVVGVRGGDFMVLLFEPAQGELVWSASYNGPANGYDAAAAAAAGPAGEILVTGFSGGVGTGWDYLTAAYDPSDGSLLWEERYDPGDSQSDEAKAIAVGPAGDLYVTGFGYMLATGSDIVSLRYVLESATGVGRARPVAGAPVLPLSLSARPNPFLGEIAFSIDLPRSGSLRVAVFDARGRLEDVVYDGPLGAGGHRLVWDGRDASGRSLAPGVYFARFEAAGAAAVRKIVLAR